MLGQSFKIIKCFCMLARFAEHFSDYSTAKYIDPGVSVRFGAVAAAYLHVRSQKTRIMSKDPTSFSD